ncbi:peptidoglycan-binding protein [Patescibacteria group bacterium]|nr:peptidoglycan-binding protein [Patescibacteria group bacterium]
MQTVTTKAVAKVAAVATGLAMATSMLSLAPIAHAAAVSCTFTKDLTVGSRGADVTCLQNSLIAGGYSIPAGATGYFGSQTRAAVSAWQKAMKVSPTAGYFGPKSRAVYAGGAVATPGTPGTPAASAGTGTGLKVSLAPTSPSGSVLVQGQGIGLLARFQFANPTASPINVTALTFNRTGVSNDSSLTNIYLYNNGQRITDSAGISSSAFTFNNPAGLFTIPAGGVYVLGVRSDIAGSTSGQQIGVNLVQAVGSVALDSSVSLPVVGGFQTISAASLAGVQFGAAVTPSVNTSINPQVNYPIWQNTVSVSTNPVKLSAMKFSNLGSISAQYVTNLRLYIDGVQAGSAVPALNADGTLYFDLSAAPVSLSTSNHTIKLLADVTGGASRSIVMSVQRSADVMFVDSQLNQPVTVTNNGGTAFSAQSTATITINSVSGTTGISTSLDPSSPSSNVAVGSTNVKLGTFDMLATGENVKVNDLYVYDTTSIHAGGLQNGKIFLNGVQVGSTKNIGEGSSNYTDFSMGSSLILPMGQTVKVDVYADMKTSTSTNLSSNETVSVTLHAVSNNAQGQSSLQSATVPGTDIPSTTLTLTATSLTAAKFTGYGNQTVIAGSQNAKLGAFALSAGSTEGVTVNTILLTMSPANAASITNLTMKDDATGNTIGTIITTPSNSNSYAVTFDIPVSGTKVIDVYGNLISGANAGTITVTVDPTTGGTGDVTGLSATVGGSGAALQAITVGPGSLTVAAGANYQTSSNVIAGASGVNVGEFTFTAQYSGYTVNNLAILVPNGVASSVAGVTVSYTDQNNAAHTANAQLVLSSSSLPYATATFTGLGMYVPAGGTANLDVSAGIATIASSGASGAGVKVLLDSGSTNGTDFLALNSAGTALKVVNNGTDVSSGGTFYVHKSIPTVAVLSGQGGAAVSNPIYKFSVSADPAGALEWTKMVFNVATTGTGANLTGVNLTDMSGNSLIDNNTSSASTTQTTITIDLTKNATMPQYQAVAAGATNTYYLTGNMGAFPTGAGLTISLAQDTNYAPNNTPSGLSSNNFIWSDRSGINGIHTSPSVAGAAATADYTNGYLIRNFTSTAVSYSH